MSDRPWYRDPREAGSFLAAQAAAAGVAVLQERDADGAPRIVLKADSPLGTPLPISVRLQGSTVRLTAHRVTQGPISPIALRNYNVINQAPWAGRAYPSPDGDGTDFSLGAPAPADPAAPYPLAQLLGVVHAGAAHLALGRAPEYAGPQVPDPAPVLARAGVWLEATGAPVERRFGGEVLAAGARTPANRPVALEVFVLGRDVLVARAVPRGADLVPGGDEVFAALAGWNAGAAAGAAAWWPETGLVYGSVSVPPAVIEPDDATLRWLADRALEAADGAVGAVAGLAGAS